MTNFVLMPEKVATLDLFQKNRKQKTKQNKRKKLVHCPKKNDDKKKHL